MKTPMLLALAALAVGCGAIPFDAPADLVTNFGSRIYLNEHSAWTTADEASALQSELLTDLQWGRPAKECLGRTIYLIEQYPIARCESGHPCFGYADGQELHVGAAPRNPWGGDGPRLAPFKHETIHYLQGCVLGISDRDHRRSEWMFQ
ncbi:MAG TPA: hypothetical protein VN918_04485 [Myxococcaceae bacterium]|nr:hypothetical protein [Myxococcaceae bacterium]